VRLSHFVPFLFVATPLAAQTAPASKPEVVQYHATIDNVKYIYGPAAPVAHLKSGNILEANSLDCFGNAIKKPGDTLALSKGDNPLTGPFFIETAEPGDTLAIHILDLQVDGDQGLGAFAPGFGAINETNYTPMLHPPLPEKIWFYPIDHANNTATFQALDSNFKVKFPLHPFLGCIGVAPANGEARSSVVPAEFGGNMDAPEVSAGNILYLPVNVAGGLLYFGDGHAAMGDGEIAGTAVEVPMKARLRFDLITARHTNWPRALESTVPSTTLFASPSPNSSPGFTTITASPNSTPTNSSLRLARFTSRRWSIPTTSLSPLLTKNICPPGKTRVPYVQRTSSRSFPPPPQRR
jgi:acetamidase/formamidase